MSNFVKNALENGPAQKAARVAAQLKDLGASAVARQTIGAAASGGATIDAEARTSLAAIRTALINLGLCAA